jgi:hypothetical protein
LWENIKYSMELSFEKLIVGQLDKDIPCLSGYPKVYNRVHRSTPLDPILI